MDKYIYQKVCIQIVAAQFVLTFSNHNIFLLLIDETITTNEKQLLMNGNLLRYEFMHESVRLRS